MDKFISKPRVLLFGLLLLIGGFLIGRATAPVPMTDSSVNSTDISAPVITELEHEEPPETEPSISNEEQPNSEIKYIYLTTFYATVLETDNRLLVQGIENNSAEYREDSQFVIAYSDDTKVTLNGKSASIDDIAVGDSISISFFGGKLETDPAQLQGVLFINVFRE